MNVAVNKSQICGSITICPSKSYEQRILFISALSDLDTIKINNFGNSNDVISCRNVIKNLGKNINQKNEEIVITQNYNFEFSDNPTFFCGESGLCARMLPPIAAAFSKNFTISCDKALTKRKIQKDFSFFNDVFHWNIECIDNNYHFSNALLNAGIYSIDGSNSSQVISGLIIALSTITGNSILTVNNPVSIKYILMTIETANAAGAKISHKQYDQKLIINITGETKYSKAAFSIEGDWSNAAFFIVAGIINGNVKILNLNPDSMQADKAILDLLDILSINYSWIENNCLLIEKSDYNGFVFDATNCPDLVPAIAALAIFAKTPSVIKGVSRLINKESNRKASITEEFTKLGIEIKSTDDYISISPKSKIDFAITNSHNDHRIAMMLAIIGINSERALTIENCDCIKKSYPEFFNDLKKAGVTVG